MLHLSSEIFSFIRLVEPGVILKNTNNVVICRPIAKIFSGIVVTCHPFRTYRHMTTPTSGLASRGHQRFFKTRFSRQPFELTPKFFNIACYPTDPTKVLGDMEVGGQVWEPGPQHENFLFSPWRPSRVRGPNLTVQFIGTGDLFDVWNFKENHGIFFLQKMGFQFYGHGAVALFWVHPLGGLTLLIRSLHKRGLGTLTKMDFVPGRSPPIWGRYGIWGSALWVTFSRKIQLQFSFFCWSTVL